MKVVRKILYIIAGILVLMTIFIVVCAYNPSITAKLQSIIFRGRAVEVSDISKEAAGKSVSGDNVPQEAEQTQEYRMRSLEELGVSEDSLITTIEDYYEDCRRQINEHGLGEYSFENFNY